MTDRKYIANAPIRRLMKREGAELISEKAVDKLVEQLEKTATIVTEIAILKRFEDKRKRLSADDIRSAANYVETSQPTKKLKNEYEKKAKKEAIITAESKKKRKKRNK